MKKEVKTQLTKSKIMTLAMAEFGTNGYAQASLNSICNAGVAKGLLYHNFENKDALYLACVDQCFTDFTAYLKKQDLGADLHRYMEARLCFFRENEQEARLFFEAILQPPVQLHTQIKELRKEFDSLNRKLYQTILDTVILRPEVQPEDAMHYFTLVQNMFNGYFSSPALCGMPFADVMDAHEASLSKLLDFMLYGIAERRKTT